ncbi:RNA-binding (RRM/RBD/RNP motifs) family protein [Actinidia rufa]|uniref:RNA-binding (RRM/RBD/RNP motifs) family protein n=1 Tax=Actinidia rufa TaxID=165716 RepID=A0A7J0ETR0_9ERIC|nr:RNA-binding (RRM/RBD/RNP motifs) family protein [Actinidia rufa]
MDPSKKRKADENGVAFTAADDGAPPPSLLTPDDTRKIIEPLSKEQLLDILQAAAVRHRDVLDAVRSAADGDPSKRKLFVRGLGHIDGAVVALKEPSKKIDGRMTVTQLASAGISSGSGGGGGGGSVDVSLRKIYVGNVPYEISSDRLLGHFSAYGQIEEGPLGFDKQTGKAKGFAFFVYKTEEGARASLVDPMKTIDGHQVMCKLAVDGKKAKPGVPNSGGPQGPTGDVGPAPGSMNTGYGVAGGYGGYGVPHQNPQLNQGYGNQGPASFGSGGGGYGVGLGSGGGGYGGSQYGSGSGESGHAYRIKKHVSFITNITYGG